MEKIIKVKNLSKKFKSRRNKNVFTGLFRPDYEFYSAVNNISFEINKGEAVAFLGPNGAGKTTTTKMLTGLIFPTEGSVEVLGFKPFDRKKEFLKKIGLVMGNRSGLNWDLNATQSFKLLKQIYGINDEDYKIRMQYLTELLDVQRLLEKPIRKLSLGERMKFELIGAILHNPDVLFLDEPTIGLDITSKKNVRAFLRDIHKNSNITVILTSHDMDDIEQVCERVIVINKGAKVYDDSLDNLTNYYKQTRFIKFTFEELPVLKEFQLGEVISSDESNLTFKVENSQMSKLIAGMTANYNILDIEIISVPLEEMIEDIFKKEINI